MPMITLPASYPADAGAAFMQLSAKPSLDIDDLQVLALIEASGKSGYAGIASAVGNAEAAELLNKNGREEVGHAHRIAKALKILTGEDYEVPDDEQNPLVKHTPLDAVSADLLQMIVQSEYAGEGIYNRWADHQPNVEVAKIYRLIAADERRHAGRGEAVLALLGH